MSISTCFQHIWDKDVELSVTTNLEDVVVKIGSVCTFMTPNQFAELKYKVNKFDVKEVGGNVEK